MKSLFTLTLLMAFNASADLGSPISLDCKPQNPCAYANQGMGKCVASISINGREGGRATETIRYRPSDIGSEVLLSSDNYQVMVGTASDSISFNDRTGDQNGVLQRVVGGKFQGKITIDQDFEFNVTCSNKAIGFE